MRVIPALLTDDSKELREMMKLARSFSDYVQIDFMDGRFVPSLSITPHELVDIKSSLELEAHLMVFEPANYFPALKSGGVGKVVFHFEAVDDASATVADARRHGFLAGLAVNPETGVAAVAPLLEKFDSVLLLGVHPGFYGQKFISAVLEKVGAVKALFPALPTGVDGGVKLENMADIKRSGADFVCVGSAIFRDNDPRVRYDEFIQALE